MKKVYIITDMEGISGVVVRDQMTPGTAEYERARHLLAGDVNAAIAGAFDAGCTEVLAVDGHHDGFNFLIEEMDPRADYLSGSNKVESLPGLDDSYYAMLLVGYHARAGTTGALWDHTQSWDDWVRYSVNEQELGEIGILALMAGHHGVPIVFVSGDRAATAEARALLGEAVEVAAVKDGFSRMSARCMHPRRAQDLIRAGVVNALSRPREQYQAFVLAPPFHVTLELRTSDLADAMQLRGCTRVNGHTVRKTVQSALDILRF
jgi:D-amino peptidase